MCVCVWVGCRFFDVDVFKVYPEPATDVRNGAVLPVLPYPHRSLCPLHRCAGGFWETLRLPSSSMKLLITTSVSLDRTRMTHEILVGTLSKSKRPAATGSAMFLLPVCSSVSRMCAASMVHRLPRNI